MFEECVWVIGKATSGVLLSESRIRLALEKTDISVFFVFNTVPSTRNTENVFHLVDNIVLVVYNIAYFLLFLLKRLVVVSLA